MRWAPPFNAEAPTCNPSAPRGVFLNTKAPISSNKGTTSPTTIMKNILTLAYILVAFGWSSQAADTSVKLSNVHLCCNGCVKGVDKALSGVTGVKAQSDKDAGTVTLNVPDKAAAQK